jgi:hypothetical protein
MPKEGADMPSKTLDALYSDNLVVITRQILVLYNYYFWGCSKTIPVNDIDIIETLKPGLNNGSWRLWGSSSLMGWMPMDWRRPGRDRIFLLHYKNKKFQIGFTAENSALAESALKQLGLMRE